MLLNDIKKSLRILNTDFDDEISDLIDSAKADLILCGVNSLKVVDTDALIKRAVTIYVKANFGWANEEAERLQKSYEMLRDHLVLTIEYGGVLI